MGKINDLLSKIELLSPKIDEINQEISTASVGWHLEHSLLIMNSSLKSLSLSNPKDYNPTFSLKKFIFLNFGFIPRGKISAPKSFFPLENQTNERISKLIDSVKEKLKNIIILPNKTFITHPFLGDFDKKTTLKFLFIHTNHHLKIINDILNK